MSMFSTLWTVMLKELILLKLKVKIHLLKSKEDAKKEAP